MTLLVDQAGVASESFRMKAKARNRVPLLLNDNISGALLAKKVIPAMLDLGIEPVIFILHPTSPERAKIKELLDFGFYDSMISRAFNPILPQYIPSQRSNDNTPPVSLHFIDMARRYSLSLFSVADINDSPEMNAMLESDRVLVSISQRNLQIIKDPLIALSKKHGAPIWNLHSGDLPDYRGVHPLLRAMADGRTESGWTLHEIVDRTIDTGPIIANFSGPVDLSNPYMTEFYRKLDEAAELTISALAQYQERGIVVTRANNHKEEGHYYTFPTAAELESWGIRMVDPHQMIPFYMSLFDMVDDQTKDRLNEQLWFSIQTWTEGRNGNGSTFNLPRPPAVATGTGVTMGTAGIPPRQGGEPPLGKLAHR